MVIDMDLITAASSFVSGLLCSMGFGGGSVLIIYLTSYLNTPQKQAQGINLIFFIPCALYSVIKYKKDGLIDVKVFRKFVLWGILGVIAGYMLINNIPSEILKRFFGMLLIFMGIKDLFSNKNNGTAV